MYNFTDLYNKYAQNLQRLHSLEVKQFRLEEHLADNPTDYVAVVNNFKLKSDMFRVERKLKEIKMKLEVEFD